MSNPRKAYHDGFPYEKMSLNAILRAGTTGGDYTGCEVILEVTEERFIRNNVSMGVSA